MVVEASHVKVPVPMLFESEMSLASILKKVVLEFAYSLNCVEHLDKPEDGDSEQKRILLRKYQRTVSRAVSPVHVISLSLLPSFISRYFLVLLHDDSEKTEIKE